MGRATIDDVARHCGLSRATISRVLNREGNVRPATRARAKAAVEALGYFPSYLAPGVTMHYYSHLLQSIDEVARGRGCHILIKTRDCRRSVLTLLGEERAEWFVIRHSGEPAVDGSVVRKLKRQGVFFVFIGKPNHDSVPSISADNAGGYRAACELFGAGRADAVFAANDQMALGVLHYLYERKIDVPREVAVAAFDDSFFAEFICPPPDDNPAAPGGDRRAGRGTRRSAAGRRIEPPVADHSAGPARDQGILRLRRGRAVRRSAESINSDGNVTRRRFK